MNRTVLFALTSLATALLAVGCAPHKIQYYQLSAVPAQPALAPAGPMILVGHIAVPVALQDGRIRYREGANEVGAYEYHRWIEQPGMMVRDSLIMTLRSSGRYSAVQETGSGALGDYTVRGKLLEFAEIDNAGIQTRVTLDLELRESKTGRLVWNQTLTHNDPVEAKKVAAVAQSLDRNLQTVVTRASEAIGGYVGAHPVASR